MRAPLRALATATLAVVFGLVSCAGPALDPAAAPRPPMPTAHPPTRRLPGSRTPASRTELPTTDPAIAIGNLEGEIGVLLEKTRGDAGHASPAVVRSSRLTRLTDLLLLRAQILGRVSDYPRAEATAAALVTERPDDAASYVLRARVRTALHCFPDALDDLERAAELGADASDTDPVRATILQATARHDQALAIRARLVERRPTLETLGAQAALLGEMGEVEEAEARFSDAELLFRDVSPFRLAWLYTQQGLFWERAGDLERARELLAAAHERLPSYAAAASHLGWLEAALGRRSRALEVLRAATASSEDPEALAVLSRVLRESGAGAEAARLRTEAAARYQALVAAEPEAWAEHAAIFWLGVGEDPARALALARWNAELRGTPAAYTLLAEAATAAGEPARACQAAEAALWFGRTRGPGRPLAARAVAERIARGCGEQER